MVLFRAFSCIPVTQSICKTCVETGKSRETGPPIPIFEDSNHHMALRMNRMFY